MPLFPIFLLASGPPTWRAGPREALATLQGHYDLWILLQAVSYLAAGVIAFYFLARQRGVARRQVLPILLAFLLVFLCGLSAFWAPSFVATAGMSGLLGIAIVVAAQTAGSDARRQYDAVGLLVTFRALAIILVLLVWATYEVRPGIVAFYQEGQLRVRGGRVGAMATLGPTIAVISLYLMAFRLRPLLPQLLWIALGLFAIWLSETRAAYVAVLVGAAGVWFFWMRDAIKIRRMAASAMIMSCIVIIGIAGLLILVNGFFYDLWTRGHPESVSTMSQRTVIWSWILKQIAAQPYGFGYVSGFRYIFQKMDPFMQYNYQIQGLVVPAIGEAHNAHLEFLIGVGWLGLAIYVALVLLVGRRIVDAIRYGDASDGTKDAARITGLLLLMYFLDGMTNSSYALPTQQTFGSQFFALAMVFMLEARAARTRASIARSGASSGGLPGQSRSG